MYFRAVILGLLCSAAVAQEHLESDHHVALTASTTLSLGTVVERALAWQSEPALYAADRALADSEASYANGVIAESPVIGTSYQSDKPTDSVGLRQSEVFLRLPLFTPRERSSQQDWAQSRSQAVDVAQAERRWRIAGEMRDALWLIAQKRLALAIQQRHEKVYEQLLAQTSRRVAAGDAARYDVLLAEQELLATREAIHMASAELVDAQRQYYVRSGLEEIPAAFRETQSASHGIDASHPLLAAANTQVELARRAHELALKQSDSHPSVTFNIKRDQSFSNEPTVDSVGAAIEWPLGGGHSRVRVQSTNLNLINAEIARRHVLRQLESALHEAQHRLEVLGQQIADAERAAAIGNEQLRMQRLAYDSGEISLQDLLLVERRQFVASQHLEQLRTDRDYAIAQYNQAVGVLP